MKPLKWYKDLSDAKVRRTEGFFLVEGVKAIEQIVLCSPDALEEIVVSAGHDTISWPCPVRQLSPNQLTSICTSKTPQGIVAVVHVPQGVYSDDVPEQSGNRILVLEDIQDPGNIGTLIRTAAAFDFDGIIMSDKCADPLGPKCVQASTGSLFSVWLRRTSRICEMVQEIKTRGFVFATGELGGQERLPDIVGKKIMIALGNESTGISSKLAVCADVRFYIPINQNKAESLNVAMCGAICMYALRKV